MFDLNINSQWSYSNRIISYRILNGLNLRLFELLEMAIVLGQLDEWN